MSTEGDKQAVVDAVQSGNFIVCYTKCWACMFGHCEPGWHTWADADDVEHAQETGQPDPSTQRCGCHCQRDTA